MAARVLSTLNSTRTMATLSPAVAVIVADPETVAPEAGESMDAVGEVTSRTVTTIVSVAELPAASRTVNVIV